jgi:hypothetical protein
LKICIHIKGQRILFQGFVSVIAWLNNAYQRILDSLSLFLLTL